MRLKVTIAAVAIAAFGLVGSAAPGSWTGKISDSMCGAKHGMSGKTDKECTASCVKGGGKYVFVAGDKVMKISNQDFKELSKFAGDSVKVTGEMGKDDTLTITKIEVAPAKGK